MKTPHVTFTSQILMGVLLKMSDLVWEGSSAELDVNRAAYLSASVIFGGSESAIRGILG